MELVALRIQCQTPPPTKAHDSLVRSRGLDFGTSEFAETVVRFILEKFNASISRNVWLHRKPQSVPNLLPISEVKQVYATSIAWKTIEKFYFIFFSATCLLQSSNCFFVFECRNRLTREHRSLPLHSIAGRCSLLTVWRVWSHLICIQINSDCLLAFTQALSGGDGKSFILFSDGRFETEKCFE